MAQVNGDANANDLVNSGGDEANINENENETENGHNLVNGVDAVDHPGFAVTASAMTLWNHAHQVVQNNREHAQLQPHIPLPPNPPIRMSRRDRCLVELMVEEKRDLLIQLWQELDEVERVLGVEVVEDV